MLAACNATYPSGGPSALREGPSDRPFDVEKKNVHPFTTFRFFPLSDFLTLELLVSSAPCPAVPLDSRTAPVPLPSMSRSPVRLDVALESLL